MAHYVFSRLHRRLFWGFGFAIAASAGLAWLAHQVLNPIFNAPLLTIGVGLLLLWGMAGGVSRAITRPLLELVKVTREIGEGKLDSRMRLGRFGHGEVGLIARSVNDMAQRIEKQLSDQRELLATVSHELRTPLGHMRVLLDTARESPGDPAALAELEREILEVDRLVDQLLASSRVEFGEPQQHPIDLAELAVRALDRSGVDASCLEVETEQTRTRGDASLLLAALSNLIRNAEQHGGGVRQMTVDRVADELVLRVCDRGPGFAPGQIDRVFETFYRGENRAGGSLGLGLSLVQRIADAHGGRAWAENLEEGGACVGIALPLGTH